MRYRIKARLAELGMTNLDLIKEMSKRGFACHPTQFSNAINGKLRTERGEQICEAANSILKEIENEVS